MVRLGPPRPRRPVAFVQPCPMGVTPLIQIITTNKPTPSLFTGWMPFLSPNQQCHSTEGKVYGK